MFYKHTHISTIGDVALFKVNIYLVSYSNNALFYLSSYSYRFHHNMDSRFKKQAGAKKQKKCLIMSSVAGLIMTFSVVLLKIS